MWKLDVEHHRQIEQPERRLHSTRHSQRKLRLMHFPPAQAMSFSQLESSFCLTVYDSTF